MFIVVVMLFSVVVSCTKDPDEAQLLGFGPSTVMRITSALFFVVLLAHIHLRDSLQIQEVAFIEYIYFQRLPNPRADNAARVLLFAGEIRFSSGGVRGKSPHQVRLLAALLWFFVPRRDRLPLLKPGRRQGERF